jgi:hypothetical protein
MMQESGMKGASGVLRKYYKGGNYQESTKKVPCNTCSSEKAQNFNFIVCLKRFVCL